MTRPRLYVRSKRTTVITGRVSVESMGVAHTTTDYSEGSVLAKLSGEDARAKDLLKRAGVDFEMVDLSRGFLAKLSARMAGIRQTPTLVTKDSSSRSYAGIESISRYVNETKSHARDPSDV